MTSLFSRLQKLNKEATPGEWEAMVNDGDREAWILTHAVGQLYVTPRPDEFGGRCAEGLSDEDAALIVECRNSLPAVLNLIEAAQPFAEGPTACACLGPPGDCPCVHLWRENEARLREALAVFVSGQEEEK